MSKESQNFLQRAFKAYTDYNPYGANDNAKEGAENRTIDRNQYLEDQFTDRLDPTKPERGVKPTLLENLVLGIDRNEFKDAGGRINIRNLKKTAVGEEAEALGLTINPNSKETKLQRRVDRKKQENQYSSLSTRNPELDVTSLSDSQLTEEIRKAGNTLAEQEKYGVVGPDGNTRTGGTVAGQLELTQADDASKASQASVRASDESVAASKAATVLNSVVAQNDQINQVNADEWNKYVYGDGKREAQIERDWQAGRDDAQFDANLATIKLQNAAEMERYEMMLQNDKEVRQSESISDLMAALSMLGGAFML